ncbi:MAG: DUF1833 family protein [Paracoccaceae bacterium]
MTRASAEARRVDLEQTDAPDAILGFLTISHIGLPEPIRVVSDASDYLLDGQRFVGLPFGFRILTDTDEIPRTQLTVQNVDRRMGEAVLAMRGRAEVAIELRSSADFDLAVHPRVPLAATAPIYAFRKLTLRDVTVTATELSGTVMLHDYTTEPWPSQRAIEARLPGLFW